MGFSYDSDRERRIAAASERPLKAQPALWYRRPSEPRRSHSRSAFSSGSLLRLGWRRAPTEAPHRHGERLSAVQLHRRRGRARRLRYRDRGALCVEMSVDCELQWHSGKRSSLSCARVTFDAIAANMSITEKRRRLVSFTDRYHGNIVRFVARKVGVRPRKCRRHDHRRRARHGFLQLARDQHGRRHDHRAVHRATGAAERSRNPPPGCRPRRRARLPCLVPESGREPGSPLLAKAFASMRGSALRS